MITLIHGDQIEASRTEFNKRKAEAKDKEIRTLDGRTIDASNLIQALESGSMFKGDAIVFIENLFGRLGRKLKLIESLSSIINESKADVVLWENKEVGVTVIKSLGNAEIKLFKTPALIFQFLDRPTLPMYKQLTETEAPELVFSMLTRRIRQLIQLSDGVIPDGLQGWQASRLTRQAKLFTMDKLTSMYKKLLDIEFSIKNGSSPFTIRELTEQFLLEL
jgi:DNA polymerase III delta subunit